MSTKARTCLIAVALGLAACSDVDPSPGRPAGTSSTTASASSSSVGDGGSGGATTGAVGAGGTSGLDASIDDGMPQGRAGSGGGSSIDAGRLEAGVRDVYVADRPPGSPGMLLHVTNGCPFELWVHAAGKEAVLMPDNVHLPPGAAQDYVADDPWTAARVTAYLATPPANEIDKAEITFINKVINYNITYVDWVGLPVEMISLGAGSDCKRVGCYVPESEVLTGCPDGLLSGKKCLSAGSFCASASNQGTPFCHALDPVITQCAGSATYAGCAGAMGATTREAYGCSGFFGGSPKWCAAVNRGTIDNPDSADSTPYYKAPPYNVYAAWVHSVCPGIYAFPYDDYGHANESGFHACTGGTQLNVTFCPSG